MMSEKSIAILKGSAAIVFIALSTFSCKISADQAPVRPNVILVITDDQGYGDLSVHGNPVLQTPNLDNLYDQSIRFTDFHVAPMCTPTRGQLLTGRDAMDNGATMVCMGRSMVREELPTMADIFKASGYRTAMFGKWHLGDSYPYRPQDRGFEETVWHGAFGIGSIADHYGNTYWNDTYWHNGKPEKYKGYCTDVWFDLALDYIRKSANGQEPFFLYLPTNAAHAPHLCDDQYSDPYLQKGMKQEIAKFYGQITTIDNNMGRLMQTLDETGIAENTILIFMTDNGTTLGHHVYTAGMRGHKTEPYEGGHRVPFFVKWPAGEIGQPRDIDVLAQAQDVLPTLIEWCRLQKPVDAGFDGLSLAPAIKGNQEDLEDRMLVVEYENPYRPGENKAVLWKNWRLVKDKELYDLTADPAQEKDIAMQHPEIVSRLREYYQQWRKKTMPDYEKERYIHLGTANQNPLVLYSSDWKGSYADNQGNLFAGDQVGYWDVMVDSAGIYEFTLSRWHPASGIPLTGMMKDRQGRERGALPVAFARLKIAGFDSVVPTKPSDTQVKFTVDLPKGINRIETWFLDANREPVCSAYYTVAELLRIKKEI